MKAKNNLHVRISSRGIFEQIRSRGSKKETKQSKGIRKFHAKRKGYGMRSLFK